MFVHCPLRGEDERLSMLEGNEAHFTLLAVEEDCELNYPTLSCLKFTFSCAALAQYAEGADIRRRGMQTLLLQAGQLTPPLFSASLLKKSLRPEVINTVSHQAAPRALFSYRRSTGAWQFGWWAGGSSPQHVKVSECMMRQEVESFLKVALLSDSPLWRNPATNLEEEWSKLSTQNLPAEMNIL